MVRTFIEGLPCAGKSLLIKSLERENRPVIHELGRVVPKDEFPGNGNSLSEILEIDGWFVKKECERTNNNSGYFDRSYLTHLVYAYAYGRFKELDSFNSTVNFYKKHIGQSLPMPDSLVLIDIDSKESIKRQIHKLNNNPTKALDSFWRNPDFLEDTLIAYQAIIESCVNIPIYKISGYLSTEEKTEVLKNIEVTNGVVRKINLDKYLYLLK